MRALIDFVFQTQTVKFFRFQMLLYLFGFIIPFFIQLLCDISQGWVIFWMVISMFTTLFFFLIEIIQINYYGFKDYISETWNKFDISYFLLYTIYFFLRVDVKGNMIPFIFDGTKIFPTTKRFSDTQKIMILLNVIIIC